MLKLINIPNIVYDWLANGFPNEDDVEHILEILRGGITIPDNATNGDVIKALFKPNHVERTDDDVIVEEYTFNKEWWNSPYQKGGKE